MSNLTKSEDVATALKARLATITIAQGAETNIGASIKHGRVKVPLDEELPCLMLVEGSDDTEDAPTRTSSASIKVRQPYVIDAFDLCDPDDPNVKAHAMIRDIKRAIFKGDRTLGGQVYSVAYLGKDIGPRPDGKPTVQARVVIEVAFVEDLSNP